MTRIKAASRTFSQHPRLRAEILAHFPNTAFNENGVAFDKSGLIEYLDDADGAVIGLELIDDEVLAACPRLRIVAKYGVGLDGIDTEACTRRGVAIGWTGGVNRRSVSEMALAFMISLSRNLYPTSIQLKGGVWHKSGGAQLSGKTVGIIGLGNVHLLEAARTHGVRRFVYASSAYAFSPKGSFYGISKLTSEKLVEEYAERFGLPYTIIRYGSVYGERADHHNGMYRLLRQAIENGEIRHQGSGEEVREYIHAADAAKLSVDVIEDDKFAGEHVILTGVERLKIKDLMHMIREIMSDRISVTHTNEQYDGHYTVTPYSFDPNMAKKLVPNPYIDMGQGLVSCIRHIHEELHPSTD